MRGGRAAIPTRPAGDRNLALYLSLFLILAAFFLLLNSMSQRQPARTDAAVAGVARAFAGTARATPPMPRDAAGIAWAEATGRGIAEQLPLGTTSIATHERGARLVLPVDALFHADSAAVRQDRIGLIDRLADQMNHPPPGSRPSIELRLGAADRGAAPRAEALARALIGRGVATDAMTVGVAAGGRHTIELLIATRPAAARVAEARR